MQILLALAQAADITRLGLILPRMAPSILTWLVMALFAIILRLLKIVYLMCLPGSPAGKRLQEQHALISLMHRVLLSIPR